MKPNNNPRIAFIYDRVNKFGGAERVLMAMKEIWPNAPLYTSVYNAERASWAKDFTVKDSWLSNIPFVRNNHEYFFWLMPYVFESFDLSEYDIVISITSAEAKGVITRPDQLHICYLLTPTRYLWSHTHEYLGRHEALGFGKIWNSIKSSILQILFSKARRWDYLAAQRIDHIIPISNHVAKRVEKFYRKKPEETIYPPVDVDKFLLSHSEQSEESSSNATLDSSQTQNDFKNESNSQKLKANHPKGDHHWGESYFLIVSRLVKYKSIDYVIEAFKEFPNEKLLIVGSGKDEARLKNLAGDNVIFTGQVSETALLTYYNNAKAFIFPQEEDFGITAVEAQAAGLPVIAYQKGGATETVSNKTGVFYKQKNSQSLHKAIQYFIENHTLYDKNVVKYNSKQFSKPAFKKLIRKKVESLWQQHQTERK